MRLTGMLFLAAAIAAPSALRAADPKAETKPEPKEERVYTVTADGKRAGTLTLVIEGANDGIATAKFNVDITVRVFIKEYRYSLKGYEVWNRDRLVKLETQTNDDGKSMELKVEEAANGKGLVVTQNPKQFNLNFDIWTTTYWREPGEEKKLLMDADTGKLLQATWQKVGVESITAMGQKVNCTHYRVSGAARAELWFDGSKRLIRQEIVESGVKMVTEIREYKK